MSRKRTAIILVSCVGIAVAAVLGALELRPRFRPVRDAEPTAWEGKWEVPLIEGDHQSETFVLARNKLFRLRVEEKVWDFHEGESVTVRWEPGKVFVNDIQVVPNPETRKVYPVSHIKKVYGNIPGVREYIAAHRGEASEDEVATRAVELWFEKKQNVVDKATKLYIELVKKRPPREAAEAASEVISESGLADSAVVSMANPPESEAQDVYLYWRGAGSGEMMSLVPWWREVAPPTVIAKRTYADLTHELDRLTYGGNTLKVGFEGGTLIIDGTVIAKPKGANQ